MSRPIVFVSRKTTPGMRALFDEVLGGAAQVVYADDVDAAGRRMALGAAEVLVAQNIRIEYTAEELAGLANVRLVQALTAGVDHMPFSKLPSRVMVAGNPGAYAEAMAEHVVAVTFAAGKRLLEEDRRMRAGEFNQFVANRRMAGSICAIIGFGGVGRHTARLLRPLGMAIHAINRSGATDETVDFIGTLDDLEIVLRAADIVVVALSLTHTTRGLIGARELSWLKDDAILVNVSRGEIIDQSALYERLVASPTFTACIDAWWVEPVRHGEFRLEHPFLDLPNVIASPHNSAAGATDVTRPLRRALENVRRYLDGEAPRWIVGDDEKLL